MPRFKFDPNKGRPILVMVMTQAELEGPTVVHPGMNHLMGMVDILYNEYIINEFVMFLIHFRTGITLGEKNWKHMKMQIL